MRIKGGSQGGEKAKKQDAQPQNGRGGQGAAGS